MSYSLNIGVYFLNRTLADTLGLTTCLTTVQAWGEGAWSCTHGETFVLVDKILMQLIECDAATLS